MISRRAVSGEHLATAAHLLLVSLPSKPSSSLFSHFTCRSWSGLVAQRCQQQITDGQGDTTIAIVERVQSDELQMAEASFEQRRFV